MMGKKEGFILTLMTSLLLLVLLGKEVWSLPIQKEENTLVDLLLAYEQQVPLSQINATLGAFHFKDLLVDPSTASPPSSEAPSAVDSIEDAIFAALEAAQTVETSSTLRPSPPVVPPSHPFPFPPPSNPFPYPYPPPPNSISSQVASNVMKQFDLINSHPLNPHNLIGAAIVAPPPTGPPGEYIAGIFGSLAGVADNTIKLLASSSNTFFGVAGSVTCKLNPICAQG